MFCQFENLSGAVMMALLNCKGSVVRFCYLASIHAFQDKYGSCGIGFDTTHYLLRKCNSPGTEVALT